MSILDQYMQELQQDTAIDEFTMKDVQMKLPGIKHKWTGRLIRTKIDLSTTRRDKNRLINKLSQQLMDQSPVKLSIPVAKQKVKTLDEVVEFDTKIDELALAQEFCEKAERILNSMTFDIKNLTEIIKLETQ